MVAKKRGGIVGASLWRKSTKQSLFLFSERPGAGFMYDGAEVQSRPNVDRFERRVFIPMRQIMALTNAYDLLVPTYWDTYNPMLSVRMATVPARTKNLIFKIAVEHKFPTNEPFPVGHGIPNAELLALLNWD